MFLRGELPASRALSEAELDRVIGTLYATVEQTFQALLRIGFASRFALSRAPAVRRPAASGLPTSPRRTDPDTAPGGAEHRPNGEHRASAPDVTTVDRMGSSSSIVGGGNMGAALLGGLLAGDGADPATLAVVEALAERRRQLERAVPRRHASPTPCRRAPRPCIAVKPPDVAGAVAAAVAAGAAPIAVDRRRRVDRRARGRRPGRRSPSSGRCRTRRRSSARARRRSPAGPSAGDDDLAWAERDPRRRRHRRARRRAPPRRRHRPHRLRPGLPVPRRRGA